MIPYILHVSLLVAGFLAFYKVFLQRETFFRLNRIVLLACLLIAFGLPLARVPAAWSLRKASTGVASEASVLLHDKIEALQAPQQKAAPSVPAVMPRTLDVPAAAQSEFNTAHVLRWIA
jgi:hypothetical protein